MALQTHYALVLKDGTVELKKWYAVHLEYLEGWGWCEKHGQDESEPWPMGYMTAQAILAKMNQHKATGSYCRPCTDNELKDAQNA